MEPVAKEPRRRASAARRKPGPPATTAGAPPDGASRPAGVAVATRLDEREQALLADLFAIVEEHAEDGARRDRPRIA